MGNVLATGRSPRLSKTFGSNRMFDLLTLLFSESLGLRNDVEAGGLAGEHHLAGIRGDSAQSPGAG